MVDEAKAFCPGCGNAFVMEEKAKASAFQNLETTTQFGQTMYNQMLEDMGLNIADVPNSFEKRVEVIKPIEAVEAIEPKKTVPNPKPDDATRPASNLKWYILGGIAAVILLGVALASVIMIVLNVLARLTR